MNELTDFYELSNGVKMPCVGFGTWQTPDGDVAEDAVYTAIQAGYRHIDTAAVYGNEESVGRAVKKCSIDRSELFITTKLWNNDHGYESTKEACHVSMKKLDLEYLDLYLIHWPNPQKLRNCFEESMKATWMAMEELYETGKVKAIGVSNFLPHHMDYVLQFAKIRPMVNQIRLYPGYVDADTLEYCNRYHIVLQAYSPLGSGKLLQAKELLDMAAKYNTTVAKLCLRWSLQMGFTPLPKSVTKERIIDNTDIFGFHISEEDMMYLLHMKNYGGEASHPDRALF